MWSGDTVNKRWVNTETVTLGNAATVYSSTIDWVKPGNDFLVFGNTAVLNSVGAVTVEVQASFDGSTWATVTSSFLSDLDNTTLAALYDNSAKGDAPYYRLAIACAANDSANTMDFVVIG